GEYGLQVARHLYVEEHVGSRRAALQQGEISFDNAHRVELDLGLLDVVANGRGPRIDLRWNGGETVRSVEAIGQQDENLVDVGLDRLCLREWLVLGERMPAPRHSDGHIGHAVRR